MVIDNADDSEMFFGPTEEQNTRSETTSGGNLSRYIPECSRGSILVTTRNKQAGAKFARGGRLIEVTKMDPEECLQLVQKKIPECQEDSSHVAELAENLEYLPLALVQATAFIQENSMTISGYLNLLNKGDDDLVELLSQPFEEVGRDSSIPNAVIATWLISFNQITKQYPKASAVLSLASFFDRQGIPEVFLSWSVWDNLTPQAGLQPESTFTSIELKKAVGVLKAFSFVSTGKKDDVIDIHRLVQLAVRKWLIFKGETSMWACQALFVTADLFPNGVYENWRTCSEYLPHVDAILSLSNLWVHA